MAQIKLVASLILRNEADRYLRPCLESLLSFCDEVRAVDDNSTDGSFQIMQEMGVSATRNDRSMFYEHEGRARQTLLEWTMLAEPTHILSIDSDEFISDGQQLRAGLENPVVAMTMQERRRGGRRTASSGVWSLNMQEIWGASETGLVVRQDGGWREHPVPIIYTVPPMNRALLRHWRIPDRALACGRVPQDVVVRSNRSNGPVVANILHLGWSCEKDRYARHQRYVEHDGGKHHKGSHLDSIMWEDERVHTTVAPWPAELEQFKPGLLDRINR